MHTESDRSISRFRHVCALLLAFATVIALGACQRRETAPAPRGRQGVVQAENKGAEKTAAQSSPAALARSTYRNVPVLGDLDTSSFGQTMQDLVAWVAPQQGCEHCHIEGDAASDAKPAKVVARRMLQMVQHVNNDWKPHVGQAGITCYTCHRGQPLPPRREDEQQPAAALFAPPAAGMRRASTAADEQAAARGLRMLADLNSQYLGEASGPGAPAAPARADCATCHQSSRLTSAGAPLARDHAAMTLVASEAPAAGSGLAPARARSSDACADAAASAASDGARLGAALTRRPVQGGDRVMLYAAPDSGCPMLDLHLQPGDELEAFVTFADYTSVRYRRTATGSEARGWIRPERLGPGLAPGPLAAAAAPPAARTASSITAAVAGTCRAQGDASESAQPQPGRAQVLGQGRLQFYSAPDAACPLHGIFILPGEAIETLHRLAGYTAVRYVNPRTGNQASGWVLSSRVGAAGTVLR
jgi:hypothetical protein